MIQFKVYQDEVQLTIQKTYVIENEISPSYNRILFTRKTVLYNLKWLQQNHKTNKNWERNQTKEIIRTIPANNRWKGLMIQNVDICSVLGLYYSMYNHMETLFKNIWNFTIVKCLCHNVTHLKWCYPCFGAFFLYLYRY